MHQLLSDCHHNGEWRYPLFPQIKGRLNQKVMSK